MKYNDFFCRPLFIPLKRPGTFCSTKFPNFCLPPTPPPHPPPPETFRGLDQLSKILLLLSNPIKLQYQLSQLVFRNNRNRIVSTGIRSTVQTGLRGSRVCAPGCTQTVHGASSAKLLFSQFVQSFQ